MLKTIMRDFDSEKELKLFCNDIKEILGESPTIVELGSYMGESSLIFAQEFPKGKIICIDSWEGGYDNRDSASMADYIDVEEQFDLIEDMVHELAEEHGVDTETIWEDFESVDDVELFETAAWRRKEGKNPEGGLNRKGIASYRAENPGSKLSMAVTTPPSKLKPGSKAANRRKSFCARMGGMEGPMKKPNGEPTRKALALRKWNC
jgi:hypothetical protein